MGKRVIVGVSGKIGSGKNYLADKLVTALAERGFTSSEGSFAYALKNELNHILNYYRKNFDDPNVVQQSSVLFDIPLEQMEYLLSCLRPDLEDEDPNDPVDGYSRTEGVRRGLQYLGTDIRRTVYENYWVDKFHETLAPTDFVFVTDVRFPNEADSILENEGVMFRLNPSPEVIAERTIKRDGLQYTKEALNHKSETALDNYPNFTHIIGDTFDTDELCDLLVQKHSK